MRKPKTTTATSPMTTNEQQEGIAAVANLKTPARQTAAVSGRYESSRNMPSIALRSEGDTEVPGNP